MDQPIFNVTPEFLALVPIVMGLVEVAKIYINSRYAPVLSLLLGIGGAFLIADGITVPVTLLSGIVVGLTASGIYAGTKATFK